jgi:hypothetical protein
MRPSIALVVAVCLLTLVPHRAGAVSEAVKEACRADYHAYCAAHEVGSDALRDCMIGVFDKLSPACVSAIMDSEAPTREATARKHSKHIVRKNPRARAVSSRPKRYIRHARRAIAAIVHRIRRVLH